MNQEDILSGKAGLAGIHQLLHGQSSRRLLRGEVQSMLREDYRAGAFRLTRAKFKPGRKLSAYFTFPVFNPLGKAGHSAHLAVTWQNTLEDTNHANGRERLQDEAELSGLMPVQRELWRDLPEQGIRLQIWPFDLKFPQLVRLGNPSHVSDLFVSLGIAHDLKQLPVITPIRYRPKERHVLRYEIYSPETTPGRAQLLYAKLYSNPDDTARAFGIANRVVDWLDANDQGLQGNRPEAMSQGDGVIFYPHAPGVPLSHQLHRSGRWLATRLKIIGSALANMHNGPETLKAGLKENTLTNEAKVVRRASEHIQALLPRTHDKILEIVDRVEAHYSRLPQETPTFTHSDFKADHLLCTPRGLTLIDFDTCKLTDPALDIGKFLADLEWWFTSTGISGLKEAQAELLEGYVGEGEPPQSIYDRLARAKLFHVLILVKIVLRRVPIYKKDWAAITDRMIDQAAHVLRNAVQA
ncbi:MAG TPA: aminoglycoside phosphotransferase family protein [Anaerolineales bacterium]|nr:aminoglycoside phosphotransferase family protein [Anaerolineales bacterium]